MGGFYLPIEQQVLLGGQVVKVDVVLHADPQLLADLVHVALHVPAVHLDGAGGWCEEACEKRPGYNHIHTSSIDQLHFTWGIDKEVDRDVLNSTNIF